MKARCYGYCHTARCSECIDGEVDVVGFCTRGTQTSAVVAIVLVGGKLHEVSLTDLEDVTLTDDH